MAPGLGAGGWAAFGAIDPLSRAVADITQHRTQAQRRLIAQFQKPNALALVGLFADRTQALEDELAQIEYRGDLDTATGRTLDQLGERVGLAREGAANEVFRTRLRGAVAANASAGAPPDIKATADILIAGSAPAHLREDAPGVVVIETLNLDLDAGATAADILARSPVAGNRVILEYELPVTEGPVFGWDDDASAGEWYEWGADPGVSGGVWAEASDGGATQ